MLRFGMKLLVWVGVLIVVVSEACSDGCLSIAEWFRNR